MSRVFLIASNTTIEPYPVYPLGMAVIASALAAAGHEVRQFDFLAEGQSGEALAEALRAFDPDLVGLSLRNVDNVDSFSGETGWYLDTSRRLAGIARDSTSAPLVIGGAAFSLMPEEMLDYLGADYGIVGEGERAVCALADAIKSNPPARGIRGEAVPLSGEEMPSPLLEANLAAYYLNQSGMLNIQTKRGCPHRCAYCCYPHLEGRRFRARPPAAVAEDLERMIRDLNARHYFFADGVFNDDEEQYLEVAEEICRRKLSIRWCGYFRPKGLGRSQLDLLKRSGLYALELGTDAASDATLDALQKDFCFGDVLEVTRACRDAELPCAHFIMFGGPGENSRTLAEGLANIEGLGSCMVFGFSGIRILPHTAVYAIAIHEGVLGKEDSLLKPVYYFSPAIDREAMNAAILKAFNGRRDRIFPPSDMKVWFSVLHRLGQRGILWDLILQHGGANRRKASPPSGMPLAGPNDGSDPKDPF